jgi:transposase, IS30 family
MFPQFICSMSHLTQAQRYTISVLYKEKKTITYIATQINRDKSVVSREIKRNRDLLTGRYDAQEAQDKYAMRLFVKPKATSFTAEIQNRICEFLAQRYSPEQIVGYCRKNALGMVSIERIYQFIWQDKKKRGKWHKYLRTRGKPYRSRAKLKEQRGTLKNRRCITERPAIVEQKVRFGDFEVDTIIGRQQKGAILTLNDRVTGFLQMELLPDRESKTVAKAIIKLLMPFKNYLYTITADNGKEFALHQEIATALSVDFYFAKPYHSWQRGANENLNRLVRQYVPKKTDFQTLNQQYIKNVQKQINDRPRKRFNYNSPKQQLKKILLHL